MGALGSGTGILMAVTIIYSCEFEPAVYIMCQNMLTYFLVSGRLGDWYA